MTPHEIAEQLDVEAAKSWPSKSVMRRVESGDGTPMYTKAVQELLREAAAALRTLEAEKTKVEQERDAAIRKIPTDQPAGEKMMLNAYGRACFDSGYDAKREQLESTLASAQQQIADLTTWRQQESAEVGGTVQITVASLDRLKALRQRYIDAGGQLLSADDIERELSGCNPALSTDAPRLTP